MWRIGNGRGLSRLMFTDLDLHVILIETQIKQQEIMGKISHGIWGGFSAKVGSVVGSRWKNICYIRSLAARVSNPNTARQRCQRGKFCKAVGFLKSFLLIFR